MNQIDPQTNVLIIGAGPVGLTLACELARYQVPGVRIVEKRAARTIHSNAIVVHVRTQEVLDAMGTVRNFSSPGFPAREVVICALGRQIATVPMGGMDSPHPTPLLLPQSETERLLEEHLERLGRRVERSVEAARIIPAEDSVAVTLKHADGREETVRTHWLVGCEGSASLTRKTNDIEFEGERYAGEEFVMGDFSLRWAWPAGRMQVFIEKDRTLMIFPLDPRNEFTRVLCARPDQNPDNHEPPTLEELQTIVREVSGDPEAELTNEKWRTRWRSQHRLAGTLRQGRCFLAGDAGHVHVPVGGQGMNYGIHDAFNLGWKLAAVVKENAPASLLETYATERRAIAADLVAGTDRGYHVVTQPGPLTSFFLRHVAPAALSLDAVREQARTIMAEFNVAYPHSQLTEDHGGYKHGPKPGERAPDCDLVLTPGRQPASLFDLLRGTHWTLLLFSGGEAAENVCMELLEVAQRLDATRIHSHLVLRAPVPGFRVPPGSVVDYGGGLHARYGVGDAPALCLIRPDWYVGFRAPLADSAKLHDYIQRFFLPASAGAGHTGF